MDLKDLVDNFGKGGPPAGGAGGGATGGDAGDVLSDSVGFGLWADIGVFFLYDT